MLPTLDLVELEKLALTEALMQCRGNRTHAAQLLGINTRTVQRKLRIYHLDVPHPQCRSWRAENLEAAARVSEPPECGASA